jgi:galactan endo-1,6-beta-galactosidase
MHKVQHAYKTLIPCLGSGRHWTQQIFNAHLSIDYIRYWLRYSFTNMMLHQVTSTKLLLSTFLLIFSPTSARVTTTISPTTNWGTWEGWGVSLAWWAAQFGQEDTLADIFFTIDWIVFNSVSIPGLDLNIVRYNAGASSWNTYDGSSMVVSPDILTSRQVDGYWLNWASTDPTSSSWNWTIDANQRAMLIKAQSRGVNHAELFSNLPMWWMCINHNPSGNNDGADNNLQSWNYDSHAIYLASIALEAKNSWGVTFTSVEAFNEPVSDWWVGTTSDQEGCHFDEATQGTVVIYLRDELTNRGLNGIIVSASDENTYDLALSTWTSFNSTAKARVGRVNTHGYEYGSGNRAGLYTLVSKSGISIWNSEYGEDDATGSELVSNLMLDLNNLHPTAWVYWQALD